MEGPAGTRVPNRGVYLEFVPNERIVFTDAYTSAWVPSAKPFFTGILTFENEGGRTRYTARARHWTAEDCAAHEKMGFHEGWGQATDQLARLAATLCPLGSQEETRMNPVVHFEMPYDDRVRASRFYETAFGWKTESLGAQMGNYVTAETGLAGPPHPGTINGGLFPRRPDWPAQFPSIVIAVDDIRVGMKQVASAGGQVRGEPMAIPGVGQYVSFTDTEGNRVSMLQPLPRT